MWSSFGLKDDESHASNPNLGPRAVHQSCCPRARKLRMRTPPPGLGRSSRSEHLQTRLEAKTDEYEPQDLFPESLIEEVSAGVDFPLYLTMAKANALMQYLHGWFMSIQLP